MCVREGYSPPCGSWSPVWHLDPPLGSIDAGTLKEGVVDTNWASRLADGDTPGLIIPLAREVKEDCNFPNAPSFPYQGVGAPGGILQ